MGICPVDVEYDHGRGLFLSGEGGLFCLFPQGDLHVGHLAGFWSIVAGASFSRLAGQAGGSLYPDWLCIFMVGLFWGEDGVGAFLAALDLSC